jgi:hypothetical protein
MRGRGSAGFDADLEDEPMTLAAVAGRCFEGIVIGVGIHDRITY